MSPAVRVLSGYSGETNAAGEPHGDGQMLYPTGHAYRGQFRYGKCDGHGEFSFPHGQQYTGEFSDGQRHGSGSLEMENGQVIIAWPLF